MWPSGLWTIIAPTTWVRSNAPHNSSLPATAGAGQRDSSFTFLYARNSRGLPPGKQSRQLLSVRTLVHGWCDELLLSPTPVSASVVRLHRYIISELSIARPLALLSQTAATISTRVQQPLAKLCEVA